MTSGLTMWIALANEVEVESICVISDQKPLHGSTVSFILSAVKMTVQNKNLDQSYRQPAQTYKVNEN